ncbi:MAG: CdaR family protein [Eubacteriales bacterium]|nr:CdaR family protein [Eubacteriales bacterium]
MKNKLMHNLGLKIMALLFSAVLWMIATGINNPVETTNISNVQVQLTNTGGITGRNQTYKVLENTDVVRVTVKAPKSVLGNISRENITVKADCTKMTEDNMVPIEVSVNDYLEKDIENITTDKKYVKLEIENRMTEQLGIEVVKNGTLPEGYATGTISTETNTMSISGPESVISPIKRAVVEVSLDGVTSDIGMEAQIKLLDEEGNEVSNSAIKKSIDSVKVNVTILPTKEVPLSYQTMGTPADGYAVTGTVECTPGTILIAGRESVLQEIDRIEIPESELDITDARESYSKMIDVSKYLPSGVSLGDSSFSGYVTVFVEIEAIRRKTVAISTIQVLNTPEGWLAEVVPDQNLRVTLIGLQRYLDDVDETTLIPHVDVTSILDEDGNVPAGEREIVVNFIIPDRVQQEAPVTAVIRLTKRAEE